MTQRSAALDYHARRRRGKLEVVPTKPCATQNDLSLAYTPGVSEPCLEIERDPERSFDYTARGNLVAVVSNGSAVLGLGDIGPRAAKPVMEGKAVLFKRFADIDVFDLEIASADPEEIVRVVKLLEPTFGGVNLEDIKAPDCFYVEDELKRQLSVPVLHDDQHGTAIISGAALLNALELIGKRIEEVRVTFNGAGAAGIACARYYLRLGVRAENLLLCDSRGVLHRQRQDLNRHKREFARDTGARTLEDAMCGADVFVGLSVAHCVTPAMLRSMNERPIVFAMANPIPEIDYDEAIRARPDAILATGRSDYPNQVNNVLGFPFLFRGALDVRATTINEEMKLAATRALADLAREDVPDDVMRAYEVESMRFGPEYLIPKPFDRRVLIREASAVALAAMQSGVARAPRDIDEYREELERRLGKSREIVRVLIHRARDAPRRVVYPEGEHPSVLRAARVIVDEKIARPILLGDPEVIRKRIDELELGLENPTIIDPRCAVERMRYIDSYYELRRRKGVTRREATLAMASGTGFGLMMLRRGEADALVGGIDKHYPDTIRPALQIVQMREDVSRVAGLHMMVLRDQVLFFADTTVNIDPTSEELADIALLSAEAAQRFRIEPRLALISFSNFGSSTDERARKVRRAVEILRRRAPDLVVDGEMQADTAVVTELLNEHYPFSRLQQAANVLIFPELQSANAAFKLIQRLAGADALGPILMGMRKPVHVLQLGCDVEDIVSLTALAVVETEGTEGTEKTEGQDAVRHPQEELPLRGIFHA